ncbi:MAG: pyrroline-5-carboxylate reductase [Verrucomicrobiota bacterium]|nr:pyrroline-5-carboxylate reductase [Limisphaera sp.]MDW8382177.1 pyrroline-5-carboxylate reductase [Verrucomicrobiota bacterium]
MPTTRTLGFLGTGQMATALARGFLKAGLVKASELLGSDPNPDARQSFSRETGGRSVRTNREVIAEARVLVLAVKPNHVGEVLEEIRPLFTSEHVLISIAAGVSLERLESGLPAGARVVRVMPNTPALVGAAASAFCPGRNATTQDIRLTQRLLAAVGLAVEVPEALLNAVTGLSGSGPAYVCQFVEGLTDGGVACGLPRPIAFQLAVQTVAGTIQLMKEKGLHPAQVKEMVTSPGGTTIEGLQALAEGAFQGVLMKAVRRATETAARLSSS